MKKQQLVKVIRDSILPQFPGFLPFYTKTDILAVPMGHVWRGFCFEGSADPGWFYLYYNVLPLYMPIEFYYIGIGKRLLFDKTTNWKWNEMDPSETIEQINEAFRAAKRDFIDKLTTPLQIGTIGPTLIGTKGANQLEIIAYSLAYVDRYDEALPFVEELCQRHERLRKPGEVKERDHINREKIRDFLRTNPEAAKAQLLEWEQQSIKVLKLEKFAN